MISEKQAKKLAAKMLNELYTKSTPKITWKQIIKKYSNTGISFYHKYYLPIEKSEAILEKYKKLAGKQWADSIAMEWLNYSPTSVKVKK